MLGDPPEGWSCVHVPLCSSWLCIFPCLLVDLQTFFIVIDSRGLGTWTRMMPQEPAYAFILLNISPTGQSKSELEASTYRRSLATKDCN